MRLARWVGWVGRARHRWLFVGWFLVFWLVRCRFGLLCWWVGQRLFCGFIREGDLILLSLLWGGALVMTRGLFVRFVCLFYWCIG